MHHGDEDRGTAHHRRSQETVTTRAAVIARNAAFIMASVVRLLLIWVEAPLVWFAFMITAEAALSALGLLVADGSRKTLDRVAACAPTTVGADFSPIDSFDAPRGVALGPAGELYVGA